MKMPAPEVFASVLGQQKSALGVCIMRCALTRWLLASAFPLGIQVLGGVFVGISSEASWEYCEAGPGI